MTVSNKRIRSENWIIKNKRFFSIRVIDENLNLKGAVQHYIQEDRRINDIRVNVLFNFIKRITHFKVDNNERESVENWLKHNEIYIKKSAFDEELDLKGSVRHFLYSGRTINDVRIKSLFILIKKISQF